MTSVRLLLLSDIACVSMYQLVYVLRIVLNLVVLPEATRREMCAYYIGRLTVRVGVVKSQYPQSLLARFEG